MMTLENGNIGRVGLRLATAASVALATITIGLGSPADAAPRGHMTAQTGVGFFYETFDQPVNVVLLAGGRAEAFCEDAPDDPFLGEPGSAPTRIFLRKDGSVDLKINDKDQPIHLYETDLPGPPWIAQFCESYFTGGPTPEPFASGIADLKVRVSVESESLVDVFNSVNGKATAVDGTEYKVRAQADLIVENDVPVGDPEDFVRLDLKEIRR